MEEVTPPLIPECELWPLIQMLDYEKDVIGMYLSGHPLDNYKFQLKHFKLDTISEFNEFMEAVALQPNPGRTFRLAGLITEVQHRISKRGNKYGEFYVEDYTSKMKLTLFSEDYVRFSNYLEKGTVIYFTGSFRQRYGREEYDFKLSSVMLLESLMRSSTKRLKIEMPPKEVSEELIEFMEKNTKQFPGKSMLKFVINDATSRLKFGMYSLEKGFEMNDEMASFLQRKPELDIKIEFT